MTFSEHADDATRARLTQKAAAMGAGPGEGGPPGEPPPEDDEDNATVHNITHETGVAIYIDVILNVPPTESELTYTPEMLAFRSELERDMAQTLAENPDVIFDIPSDLPPLESSGERGVGRAVQPKRNEDAVNAMLRPTKEEQQKDPFADRDLTVTKQAAPSNGHDMQPPDEQAKPEGKSEVITFGPGKTSLAEEEGDGSKKAVDWYVDIDFPPLEQKDAVTWVDAMTKLAALLPVNEESQKLVISMALNALGVNDVDQVVDQIMAEQAKLKAQNPQMGMPGMMPGQMGQGQMPPGFMPRLPPGGPMTAPPGMGRRPGGFGESMTDERLNRIIEVLDDAIEVVEHGDPERDPNYAADFHPGDGGGDTYTIEPRRVNTKGGGPVFGRQRDESNSRIADWYVFRNGKQVMSGLRTKAEAQAYVDRRVKPVTRDGE